MRTNKRAKNRTRRRLTRGGRFLSQGSWGCTFIDPPLKCKNEPTRRGRTTLAKYTHGSGVDQEYQMSQRFRAIDPDEHYFLTVEKRCELNRNALVPENQFEKCLLKNTPGSLLLSKYGGVAFNKITFYADNILPILESFEPLLEGLSFAHHHNLYHLDIKSNNIVSTETPTHTILTRFIDFGLSKYVPEEGEVLFTHDIFGFFKYIHAFYPFDGFVLNYSLTHPAMKKDDLLNQLIEPYKQWISKVVSYHKAIRPIVVNENGHPLYGLEEIRADLETTIANINDSRAILEFTYSMCDVFAMGLVFGEVFKKLGVEVFWDTTTTPVLANIRLQKPSTTRIEFVFNRLEGIAGLTDDQRAYLKEVSLRILSPLFNLIAGMTNLLISGRMELGEVSETYTKILKHARRLLTPQLINQYLIPASNLYNTLIKQEDDERRMLTTKRKLNFTTFGTELPAPSSIGLRLPTGVPEPLAPKKPRLNQTRRRATPRPSPPKPTPRNGI